LAFWSRAADIHKQVHFADRTSQLSEKVRIQRSEKKKGEHCPPQRFNDSDFDRFNVLIL
jgi:hypothetical protein